jgi:hypothetical protein
VLLGRLISDVKLRGEKMGENPRKGGKTGRPGEQEGKQEEGDKQDEEK